MVSDLRGSGSNKLSRKIANTPLHSTALDDSLGTELEQDYNAILSGVATPGRSTHQTYTEETKSEEGQIKHVRIFSTNNTLESVIGLEHVKRLIFESIILPIQRPELYEKYGKKRGPRILFYGPPGCGKTLVVSAIAGEVKGQVLVARLHELIDMYTGNTEKNIHQLSEQARSAAIESKRPVIIFIDELDSFGVRKRDDNDSASNRRALDQLLVELDGIESVHGKLIIIGATNRPWDIDPAMKRAGRFDDIIYIPSPTFGDRKKLFEFYIKDKPHEDLSLDRLAKLTEGFSCADIEKVVDAAIMRPLLREYETNKEHRLSTSDLLSVLAQREFRHGSLQEWWLMVHNETNRDPIDKVRYRQMVEDADRIIKPKTLSRSGHKRARKVAIMKGLTYA